MAARIKMDLEVTGDRELLLKFKQLGLNVEKLMDEAVVAGGLIIRSAANSEAPGPHIELGPVEQKRNRTEVDIGPDREHFYYMFFETGAQPHRIRSGEAGAIAFPGADGEMVVRSSVQHPGIPPRPFLRPALDNNVNPTVAAVGKVLKRPLKQLSSGAL